MALQGVGLTSAATATAATLETAGLLEAGVPAMASWVAPISTAAQIGGLGLSVLGQYQAGQAEAATMEANARNAEIEAKSLQESGKAESLKLSRERRQMLGTQASMFGAAGVDLSSGSPLDVMARTASSYEEDLQNLGYSTDAKAASKMYQSSIYDWAAPQRRNAAVINSMGTLLGGLSSMGRVRKYGSYTGYGY